MEDEEAAESGSMLVKLSQGLSLLAGVVGSGLEWHDKGLAAIAMGLFFGVVVGFLGWLFCVSVAILISIPLPEKVSNGLLVVAQVLAPVLAGLTAWKIAERLF